MEAHTERTNTVVIGAGQAGLAVGYYLKKHRIPFLILEANRNIGDTWRRRWDSLHLFTPARYDGIVGMPFPARSYSFPSKDQMAEYLESYASHFNLPVRTGVKVERLSKADGRFVVSSDGRTFEADNVVVAMASFQSPRLPRFAHDLEHRILQMHSSEYRNPSQLKEGGVLVVGAGNSGAEIALEVARTHKTWMSGRDVGVAPFNVAGLAARLFLARLLFRVVFHRILTVSTPIGRKVRPKKISRGAPLIRVKPADLNKAGVERVPRVTGVKNGKPLLEDQRVLDVTNVIWCTGFHPGFSWIDLPGFGADEPEHYRGLVSSEPGLFFVGLQFLYALSSTMIHGVSRDAKYIVDAIVSRPRTSVTTDVRYEQPVQ